MNIQSFINRYLKETAEIAEKLDRTEIEKFINLLNVTRDIKGRVFILGVGGSAGSASHMVNDLRKIAGIETYAPTDNVSELTARVNDDGWETVYREWLITSNLNANDILIILSVGGGSETTSLCLVEAMKLAKMRRAQIIGIVSRDGGMTAKLADVTVLIPVLSDDTITPHAEEYQGVVWHLVANALSAPKPTSPTTDSKLKIFLDTAELSEIKEFQDKVAGFTTNPTLMNKAGATDYIPYAKKLLKTVTDKPFSLEVVADTRDEMIAQAKVLAGLAENVVVKIPITNTKGEQFTLDVLRELSSEGISVNATAIFTTEQINEVIEIAKSAKCKYFYVSIFAGRLANMGVDPVTRIAEAVQSARAAEKERTTNGPKIEILWASPREVFNIYEAQKVKADIITVIPKILSDYLKYTNITESQFSLETVQMFDTDAKAAGLIIPTE